MNFAGLKNYWKLRKQRDHLKALVHHAHSLRCMREDVMSSRDLAALNQDMDAAVQAQKSGDEAARTAAADALGNRIDALTPRCVSPEWRENFEALVVALGVAMAFRAYFYQPFQIPTGSMQPTLYGISSRDQAGERPCDRPLAKIPNWLWTGEWYQNVAMTRPGRVAVLHDDRNPGYTTLVCGRWAGEMPQDGCRPDSLAVGWAKKLVAVAGVQLFDRGYDFLSVPNDVVNRHAGFLGASFRMPEAAARELAKRLREKASMLEYISAAGRTDEMIITELNQERPLVLELLRAWDRGHGAFILDPAEASVLEQVYFLGKTRAASTQEMQDACRRLAQLFGGWAAAVEQRNAKAQTVPWAVLVCNLGVDLPAGTTLWSGVVTTGDFVFVNRWSWNFRRPRRGEVMVFATTGINGITPGTHYIKRMCGLPNEVLSIDPPNLLIDGEVVRTPHAIARVAGREKLASWADPYAGYSVIGDRGAPEGNEHPLRRAGDFISLGADEYFAMGDNTGSSYDSRYWGPVPERNLIGPGAMVYWPFASPRWGRIE
jgi:signal peptidase I